ncbi:hypothetical protein TBLA_0D01000 [Henningerozyma blattae CBS 6284]|uniref:Uncharacterized protein n=1 Tax=Henningerozyma blattae (strain ATCC 34711 / CBS 6284 / DSM 70876 / NBRC 10599 / NRRL Y-10934 / UCD 77-7) TaxID=1071380 RepID=I2H2K6_HENB6|nr:hypothetical protein TBLA_0D01000 [Tetrapisispora blattae CBS 6284]CCH60608.1 hypothetical protein TBLA_0D01000 [Tetrapisispora blattae CBS 6284]
MSFGSKAAERLADKVILITGASAGIGYATALEYMEASNGKAKLILVARRKEKLQSLKDLINKKFPSSKVHIDELDITKLETFKPFLEQLPSDFKDIDILINNAGKALGTEKVGEIDQKDIEGMFQTNVIGLISFTQTVLPIFKAKNSGDIVNIGSIAGRNAYPGGSIYCASKFAVRAFTQSLRAELTNTNIRVMEVAPGMVETEFSIVRYKGDEDSAKNVYKGITPLVAEDIAELIVFNTSRRSNTVIAEAVIFPSCQASAYHTYRE